MKLFLIEESSLRALEQAARRLYSEKRLDGDQMRDMAQKLDGIVRSARQVPLPESLAEPEESAPLDDYCRGGCSRGGDGPSCGKIGCRG